jgi:hypothetical protein
MNTSTSPTIKRPCAAWANSLAADPDDLTTTERATLDAHVATCEACSSARADYARMDAMIRGLPAPAPLANLPAELTARWRLEETRALAHEVDGAEVSVATLHALPLRPQRRLPSRPAAFGAIAAVLIVGVVIVGFAALLSHRQLGGSTGFNGDFGSTVLPTGPQPQVENWRQIELPPHLLSPRDSLRLTPQTSVPGLIYACAMRTEANTAETRALWRGEDDGRTWTLLDTPPAFPNDPGACQFDIWPGAPDAVGNHQQRYRSSPGGRGHVVPREESFWWGTQTVGEPRPRRALGELCLSCAPAAVGL